MSALHTQLPHTDYHKVYIHVNNYGDVNIQEELLVTPEEFSEILPYHISYKMEYHIIPCC